MTVHNVGVGFALAAPHASQAASAASKEPFVETLTDFGEELAVGIVKRDRTRPVDRGMGNQGKADCSRMINCLDDVGGLVQGEVLAAVRAASLLLILCCNWAHNR
jgi:hypothetical protein